MAHAFRFLDEVALADLAFDAEGDSLEELFRGATDAVIDAMANPFTVGTAWQQSIHRDEQDPAQLLFDWLSDLVYWKDAAGVVFHEASLALVRTGGHWQLDATIVGEPVDATKQELRADVKGVTKHLYTVVQDGNQWKARVVLDV